MRKFLHGPWEGGLEHNGPLEEAKRKIIIIGFPENSQPTTFPAQIHKIGSQSVQ